MPAKLHDPETLAYPLLEVASQAAWRQWLAKNHDKSTGVNFVHYKKESGIKGVSYEEALDEALCFGWIDSTIRKIDEFRYVHQFTPRKPGSFWSDVNKRKVAALLANKKMTPHGAKLLPTMKEIEAAVKAGPAKKEAPKQVDTPSELAALLKKNAAFRRAWEAHTPWSARQYAIYVAEAKQEITRMRRAQATMDRVLAGLKIGEKLETYL
ncbi:MAG: YdeI/OmpD-associated family protein [Casimicrobium sp.]